MRTLFTFWVILSLSIPYASAQKKIRFEKNNTPDREVLKYKFRKHQLFRVDLDKSYRELREGGNNLLDLELETGLKWSFELTENPILAHNYHEMIGLSSSVRKRKNISTRTFFGKQKGRPGMIALTIDHGFLTASIVDGDQRWYIEQAGFLSGGDDPGIVVLYSGNDVLEDQEGQCTAIATEQKATELYRSFATAETLSNSCKEVEVAIASDASMYSKYGSTGAVANRNIAVMNNVAALYRHEFIANIEFKVVVQYISTDVENDPLSSSSSTINRAETGTKESSDVLKYFRYWCNLGGFGSVTHDLGMFWTNRDFTGSTIGIAYVGTTCSGWKYLALQDYTANQSLLAVLATHEIGHCFNASHDPADVRQTIMSQYISVTSTWSSASKGQINQLISSASCLSNCSGGVIPSFIVSAPAVCAGEDVIFKDKTVNGAGRTWFFAQGSPESSEIPQPVVSYSVPGTYDVELLSYGAPQTEKGEMLVSDLPSVAVSCNISDGAPGNGGISRFTLGDIHITSGNAIADGKVYVDHSCKMMTMLEVSTYYDVILSVGSASPALNEHVRIYIDYNNDGVFDNLNELVISSPSARSGTIGYDPTHSPWLRFRTPAQAVTNKLLRLRIITDQNVPANACITPVTGQVEDYSVFFRGDGTAALPVDLISFTGRRQEAYNLLEWEVTNEFSMHGYVLERSENGADFYTVTEMASGNIGKNKSTFRYEDRELSRLAGGYYYKLKMVEYDQQYTYSNIIYVRNPNAEAGLRLQNCQTLLTDAALNYELYSDTDREATFTILDKMGKNLTGGVLKLQKGSNRIDQSLPGLYSGLYFLTIRSDHQPTIVQKIVR